MLKTASFKKIFISALSLVCACTVCDVFYAQKSKITQNESESFHEEASDFTVDGNGVLLKYSGNSKEVIVPNGVKAISYAVFLDRREIEKITLPDGLKIIDEYAFYGCGSLKEVILPDSVQEIGRLAFADCNKCSCVYLGKDFKELGEFAFWGCTSLKEILVSVDNMDYFSVYGVLFDRSMSKLYLCPQGMSDSVVLPPTARCILPYAFFDCVSLKSVSMPGNSLLEIGDAAFYGCKNLKEINLGKGIKTIGSCAFAECDAIEEYTVEENVDSIGRSAFLSCNSLKKLTFLSNETKIGNKLFAYCRQKIKICAGPGSSAEAYTKKHPRRTVFAQL